MTSLWLSMTPPDAYSNNVQLNMTPCIWDNNSKHV